MDIDSLMLRADEEVLQRIVGAPTVRLLNLLDPGLASPARLRDLVARSMEPLELIEDPAIRTSLLELLPSDDAQDLVAALDLDPKEPYGQLRGMRLTRGSRRYLALLEALKVDPPSEPTEEQTPAETLTKPGFGLFTHQRHAVREAMTALDGDHRRVLLHMPTGSGKTRSAMHIVCEMLRRQEPTVVVWLAYSDELCGQAAEEFARAWSYLGDREVTLHRHWGDKTTDLSQVKDGFVVAGLSKMFAGAKASVFPLLQLADRSNLVVIDEAHQAVAETYRFLLDVLVERDDESRLLGLTATPGRTWNDPDIDRELAEYFQRQKVTLSVEGYPNPVEYLVDQGYLARPTFRSLTYAGGLSLSNADLAALEASLDIPPSILRKLADDEQRNLVIVREVEALQRRHRRTLVFATTVEHARLVASVLSARGLNAAAVTAGTPRNTRQRLVEAFKSDDSEPMVLCNYGVLTTGFDAPQTSAALIARPTKSLVLYSQMVGRATRGTRAGGNRESEIVTVADTTLPGFGDLGQAFTNWEDVW